MKRFETLIKEFKERPNQAKYYDVNRIKEELIKCADIYTNVDNNVAKERLNYLCNKCDFIINEIANEMRYNPYYAPNKEDLERVMKNGIIIKDVPQCDWDYYIETNKLTPSIINSLKLIYDNENKEAASWCEDILFIKKNLNYRIAKIEDEASFIKGVNKSSGKFVEPSLSKWINKAIDNKDSIVLSLDKALNECTVIAEAVQVINQYGCIDLDKTNKTKFCKFLKNVYNIKGSYPDLTYHVRNSKR